MLLGENNMKKMMGPYRGYDPQVDPSTNELFRLASFRFGHSGIANTLLITNQDDQIERIFEEVDSHGHVRVSKTFFRPDLMFHSGGNIGICPVCLCLGLGFRV